MKGLDSHKTGFMLGSLMAFFHAAWALLVAFGFAQSLLDFVFWIHFIQNPYTLSGFDFIRALMLVAFTFGVGYVVGYIFAPLWNILHHPLKK